MVMVMMIVMEGMNIKARRATGDSGEDGPRHFVILSFFFREKICLSCSWFI
jgi:hypothetical protein